jgi:hypothetical protein
LNDYTRLRVFYPPKDSLEFSIYSKGARAEVMPERHTKLRDLEVAALGPRSDLTVRADQREKARAVLAGTAVHTLMEQMSGPIDLEVRRRRNWQGGGVSNSVYEVQVQQPGVVTDLERLKAMHALLAATLAELQRQGIAGESFADAR